MDFQSRILSHFNASIDTKTYASEVLPPFIEVASQMMVQGVGCEPTNPYGTGS